MAYPSPHVNQITIDDLSLVNGGSPTAFTQSFTPSSSHNNKWLTYSGTNGTDTCTLNNIGAGTAVNIIQTNTGVLNFVAGSSITIHNVTGGTASQGQWSIVTAYQLSSTVWIISGGTD